MTSSWGKLSSFPACPFLRAVALKLQCASESPGELGQLHITGATPTASESAGSGVGGVAGRREWWRICICRKFPSDSDAAGPETVL